MITLPINANPPGKLLIGPWIGEFGIEIIRWQAFARTIAHRLPWTAVIVACRPSSRYLYEDFATQFIDYSPSSPHTLDYSCKGHEIPDSFSDSFISEAEGDFWLCPKNFRLPVQRRSLVTNLSTFRHFGDDLNASPHVFDLVFHARATKKVNQDFKNWSVRKWEALTEALTPTYRIASIGQRSGAHKILGTEDRRDLSLKDLAALCKHAKCVIGPSSGPMHYAMHCGTPVVTWMGGHFSNYQKTWNPWQVATTRIMEWDPSIEVVLAKIVSQIALVESSPYAIKYLVFGTKRSGHHAVLEWLTSLHSKVRFDHWNDCILDGIVTFPYEEHVLPLDRSLPKIMSENSTQPFVYSFNTSQFERRRILSFEGVPIEKVPFIPELSIAEKIIFVLRDAANFVASAKKSLPQLNPLKFSHHHFYEQLRVYDGYLKEALGESKLLDSIRNRLLFVSYDRWHQDRSYREQLAKDLGGDAISQASSGIVSMYGPGSGFQPAFTPSSELDTLNRWQYFSGDSAFWDLVSSPDRYRRESVFHGAMSHNQASMFLAAKGVRGRQRA